MTEAFAVRKTDDKKTNNKTWKLSPTGPNTGRVVFFMGDYRRNAKKGKVKFQRYGTADENKARNQARGQRPLPSSVRGPSPRHNNR